MADNIFLDAVEYAKSMLLLLKNELVLGRLVSGKFKDEVTDENGLIVNVKRPPKFVAQDGEALALQSIITGSVPITVDLYKNVHVDIGDLEHIQSYTQLMQDATLKSAASELAHTIDGSLHDLLLEIPSEVGVPGTVVSNAAQFNKAHTRLMSQSVPNSDLRSVVSFDDGELIRAALTATNIDGVNRTALEKTRIPILSEVDLFASNNIRSKTSGTRPATGGQVNGASQNVNYRAVASNDQQTFLMDTLGTTETVVAGDIFTIAGVFAVNPRSRQVLPFLKQFTVLVGGAATAGAITLTITPPIIVGGTSDGVGSSPTIVNTAFQTVSAVPANGAAIVFHNAPSTITPIRAVFHKQAISLVSARLRTPFSDTSSFVSDPETGIGIRYWRGSDISTGRHIHRWDTVYGVDFLQRELAVRVNGS